VISAIFKIKTKRFWWVDVILYFVVSLLIASLFCYGIFWLKNRMIKEDIETEILNLKNIGTQRQKDHEKTVKEYKKKIDDFSNILNSHKFASNVFALMQKYTMPNVWFQNFSLDPKSNKVQLQGEADSLDAFSRQVQTFENNEYIKSIGTFSSSLAQSEKTKFNISITLQPKITSYTSGLTLASIAQDKEEPEV
jgi:hypothetical protein